MSISKFISAASLIFIFTPVLVSASGLLPPAVPGELVVKLKANPPSKADLTFETIAGRLEQANHLKSKVTIRKLSTSTNFAVFKMDPSVLAQAVVSLKADARVAYAEPNYLYHSFESPNDPEFQALWGIKNSGQADASGQVGKPGSDIHVTSVWSEGVTGSHSVKVAVIDTGIDYNHPDLRANVDREAGYNFVTNTHDAKDDHNHGSHCAGTIGAIANNGVGVVGINWQVTLIPIKFLDADGAGTLEHAIQAIQYATQLKVNVMSNSWGGGFYSQALFDVIAEARDHGILFVAAAGNDGSCNDVMPAYPASYKLDNVLSVAATDNQDKLASFSNYGKSVDVAAPGVKIYSTEKDGKYGFMSGTSMAAPHVSGVAALLISANPSLTYAQVKNLIVRSCDKVRSLTRKVFCGGRVNAANALHEIFPVSSVPAESEWKNVPYTGIESAHPYENEKEIRFPIFVPGAKKLRVVFDTIDTEEQFDMISLTQANGEEIEKISGTHSQYTSDYLEGERAEVRFKADATVDKFGFKVSKIQAIY